MPMAVSGRLILKLPLAADASVTRHNNKGPHGYAVSGAGGNQTVVESCIQTEQEVKAPSPTMATPRSAPFLNSSRSKPPEKMPSRPRLE